MNVSIDIFQHPNKGCSKKILLSNASWLNPFIVFLLALSTIVVVSPTRSFAQGYVDAFESLRRIRDLYRRGNYQDVQQQAEILLERQPTNLIRAECLQYLGAALVRSGNVEQAEEQFEQLLNLQPGFRMDQGEFSPEVITLFDEVRDRVQGLLERVRDQRINQLEGTIRERDQQIANLNGEISRLEQEITAARRRSCPPPRRYLIVSFLPFGAGQFQNGQFEKGLIFLISEILLSSSSMVVWLLSVNIPESPDGQNSDQRALFRGYQYASFSILGTLSTCIVAGIIDAVVNFVRLRRESERRSGLGRI